MEVRKSVYYTIDSANTINTKILPVQMAQNIDTQLIGVYQDLQVSHYTNARNPPNTTPNNTLIREIETDTQCAVCTLQKKPLQSIWLCSFYAHLLSGKLCR